MLKRRNITVVGLLVLGILLAVGFFEILEKRFAEGGIYPHYASFRPDPLGTSVFYESLEATESVTVRRNITSLNSVRGLSEDTALLLLGFPRESMNSLRAPENSPVMKAVEEGARLVITLNPGLVPEIYRPEESDWFERRRTLKEEASKEKLRKARSKSEPGNESESEEQDAQPEGEEEATGSTEEDDALEKAEKLVEAMEGKRLTDELEFDVASLEGFDRPENGWRTRRGEALKGGKFSGRLPRWKSQFRLEPESAEWKSVVMVDKEPVVIERTWGKGTIVFATDSFFVSNEALHNMAHPEFLVWLMGGKNDIVFDETIHGTRESGGAMKLIRRYRLHGFFSGMLIFVGLWAWRSASSLAPGNEQMDRGLIAGSGAVSGEHSRSGLVRLLQRSVPGKQLMKRCYRVWKESQHRELSEEVESQIESILGGKQKDGKSLSPVAAYRQIAKLVSRRSGRGIDKGAGRREEGASIET